MKVIGVIPARYGSTRLEGKPLKDICGKSMIQHVYERVKQTKLIDEVIVATDDERILKEVEKFGGKAVMTSLEHTSGSSRIAEVVKDMDVEIVVNVQGDEPLIKPEMIDELAEVLLKDKNIDTATLCYKLSNENQFKDPNVVKVVFDVNGFALYFSRSFIPYPRKTEKLEVYEHIGIYAYRKDFLMKYIKLEETPLGLTEALEQLKILELGYKIKVIKSKYQYEALSVDTEEDLDKVRKIIKERNINVK